MSSCGAADEVRQAVAVLLKEHGVPNEIVLSQATQVVD